LRAEPFRLIDPELLIPAPSAASDIHFWQRLDERAGDREPRIGPFTMIALYELMSDLPTVPTMSPGDIWSILSKVANRGFSAAISTSSICSDENHTHYRPFLGAMTNADLLSSDVAAAGPDSVIALSTVEECWPSDATICPACHVSEPHRITSPLPHAQEFAAAWRESVSRQSPASFDVLKSYASNMFPQLVFSDSAWSHLGSLEGAVYENLRALLHHLAVLNDYVVEIWSKFDSTVDRQAALGSRGITASPESPNTRRNTDAMSERDFQFGSTVQRCEWHTKIRPDANRVHFAVVEGKAYVGGIVGHLTT